jgi:hypothetical protein
MRSASIIYFLFNVVELVKSFLNLDTQSENPRHPSMKFNFAEAPQTQVAPLSIRGQMLILDFHFCLLACSDP